MGPRCVQMRYAVTATVSVLSPGSGLRDSGAPRVSTSRTKMMCEGMTQLTLSYAEMGRRGSYRECIDQEALDRPIQKEKVWCSSKGASEER